MKTNMKNERDSLIEKITSLKIKQSEDLVALKDQFHTTYDSYKPLNLLKSTFHDVTSSAEVKGDLVNGAINLATGLISRKILFGISEKPIRIILVNAFQFVAKKFFPKKD